MTKNWDLFPPAEPSGEALANYSTYQVYNKFAIAGYGVLTGCDVTRNSSSRVDISSGTYTNNGARISLSDTYVDTITVASSGYHRYDLIYIDGADDICKRCAGVEGIPESLDDFLENYGVRPAEPTDTDWIPLAIIRVTENGVENLNFGTNQYAVGSVANIKMSPTFAADEVTLQVVNGVISTKEVKTNGATSVADGGTITHGLGDTPTGVLVTPTIAGTVAVVTAKSPTTFTVDFSGTTTTQTVYWQCWV